jgi:hypothetical protein
MKYILILALLLQSVFCMANSASPFFATGDKAGTASSSRDVDILKEKIILELDKQAGQGHYTVIYYIKTDKEGKQIPLLFNAMNYAGGFKVWVDDQPVTILAIPGGSSDSLRAALKGFGHVYLKNGKSDPHVSEPQPDPDFSDYQYFEAPLSKGEHIIRVEYVASPSGSKGDWVNRYSFEYSLWPASYWRSFGSLEIELHANSEIKRIETNLGTPVTTTPGILVWQFDKIPIEVFSISYEPKLTGLAGVMTAIGPFGFTVAFTILLLIINAALIKREYRIATRYFTWSAGLLGLIMPVFIFIAFFCSYPLIDAVIGVEATHFHYVGMVIVLYPFVAIAYFIIICIIDQIIRYLHLKHAKKKILGHKE